MEHGLAADGGSYCPAFALLTSTDDATLAAALGRPVTDGCPEPRDGETDAQWWAVAAVAGVATDDEGRPAHGDDTHVVHLGRGEGVLLVTDRAAAVVLTGGELLGDAAALALAFDLDEVADVDADVRRGILRRQVRSLTVELKGASWGAVGFAVRGVLDRAPGQHEATFRAADADELVSRLHAGPADSTGGAR
ncbi:MAG: hypothetical protein MUE78_00425 [Ilumatobacteraceae bacterium]|nr:hypothetical protein [Ilumatobacteraceae bacterium]